ncbi:MAG: IS110 family transposase [Promethearchaeota archaeon]
MMLANQKKPSISVCHPTRLRKKRQSSQDENDFTAFGIGMDVHKDSIVVCVSGRLPKGEIVVYREHSFRNNFQGVDELCRFLRTYITRATILMECTGVYHVSLYQTLQDRFRGRRDHLIAMNPLLVHNRIADLGTKTDRADARTLSNLAFYERILRPSYVGSPDFFTARDFMRSYHRTMSHCTMFKNRIHRHLHLANQKFPFDLGSEWGIQLLDRYINSSQPLGDIYTEYLADLKDQGKGKVLEKRAEDIVPNADVCLTESQQFLLQVDLIRLLQSQQAAALLLGKAERYVLAHPTLRVYYEQMCIIPGFNAVTILTVLTEIGDYSRFRTADAFSKFCGVVPTVEQSGNYRAKGHVNRFTNKHLRGALTQAAASIIGRPDRTTDIGAYAYKQFHLRKLPFKKCMLKVAYKFSRILYGMLTEIRQYDPHHESMRKKRARLQNRLKNQDTLIESNRTRALRRDISSLLVSHSELLNSTSKYHLVNGFNRLIRKARYYDQQDPSGK